MANILVTGAGGQLGRQIMHRARDLSSADTVVGRTSGELDITDGAAVADAIAPGTVVVNCAAHTAVDAAETEEARAYAINADGPRNLAEACARVNARLIHVSTDYIFDGTGQIPYEPEDVPAPRSAYGRTKLAGEKAVLQALPTATIVRTAWVYTGTGSDFVSTMRRLERERETVSVVDDQTGSPTYARDLAGGLLELATSAETSESILHLTNSGTATWFELARAVFAGIGADPARVLPCTSADFVRPAPRPAYSVLSAASWERAGLSPLRDWREALDDALAATGTATT
ncbi:dTDP-4-dehydrorhamnose reductase [Rhodococcoides yunnanense]|uniref:dTDP-4-dehydrorhamnose reductase n=1 Tax=Rhodococcoides yunnanense TaxID=278209 RepID=UPI0009329D0F|nr:dTDP-4-dehydrorhamnose reductase [Rhodococcus yunnanensis]